jgi:hypothetical protein
MWMMSVIRIVLFGCALSVFVCVSLCGLFYRQPDQAVQDQADQRMLEQIFDIPTGLALVSYDGYPPQVGFGQREGLDISAVYKLDDVQEAEFVQRATAAGWQPLPVPGETRLCIEAFQSSGVEVKVPWESQTGVFVCKTAGNNVLYAENTRPCSKAGQLDDIIIGVLSTDSNRLFVAIRATY